MRTWLNSTELKFEEVLVHPNGVLVRLAYANRSRTRTSQRYAARRRLDANEIWKSTKMERGKSTGMYLIGCNTHAGPKNDSEKSSLKGRCTRAAGSNATREGSSGIIQSVLARRSCCFAFAGLVPDAGFRGKKERRRYRCGLSLSLQWARARGTRGGRVKRFKAFSDMAVRT